MVITMAADVLRGLSNCDVVFADGEADLLIASISYQSKAPVLSSDSDFYIQQIFAFIPIESICTKNEMLHGKVWYRNDVASYLGISVDLLPLFAIFAGCDYFEDSDLESILAKELGIRGTSSKKTRAVLSLLRKYKTCEGAIKDMIPSLELQGAIIRAVAKYDSTSHEHRILKRTRKHLELAVLMGKASHKLVEFSEYNVFWCQTFLEDTQRGSCWTLSRPIRACLYECLHAMRIGDTVSEKPTEYFRRGVRYVGDTVSETAPSFDFLELLRHYASSPSESASANISSPGLPLRERLYCNALRSSDISFNDEKL
ncbi:XPG domain containing-domain-containing protein [Chytridium lagenaria]|nr:XPG domain containing-domain-containing protein [Chytridium lagenaria]